MRWPLICLRKHDGNIRPSFATLYFVPKCEMCDVDYNKKTKKFEISMPEGDLGGGGGGGSGGGGRGQKFRREALYIPALVACNYNPDMKAVYQRLKKAGKPFKVAITAVMRKLVILANTLVKNNRVWSEIRP